MSPNLNEFTPQQLQFAIDIFSEKAADYQNKLMDAEKYNMYYHTEEYTFKRDTAILFRVQCLNALSDVERIEKMSNN